MSISPTNQIQMGASVIASIIKSSEKPSSSSKKDNQPVINKHNNDQTKNFEADLNAISAIQSMIESSKISSPNKSEPQDLTWLRNAIRRRESVDAIVTKHIFDKLKRSRVSREQIVDILVETECPLDFALLMENAEVFRGLLERQKNLSNDESRRLVDMAMQVPYLESLKMLLHYGPNIKVRRDAFTAKVFNMINKPGANFKSAKFCVEKLMECNVIDQCTMQFLEKTLEVGKAEAIELLLSVNIDEYIRAKFGEDPLVHLFANVNVDVVKILRGRRFNVNAKCGGMSALHFATFSQLERNVRILLNSGADPNAKDCHAMTPLFAFGDEKCVKLLLLNGADVQTVADNGYTLLHMIFKPSVLGILLAHLALIEYRGVRIEKKIRDKIVSHLGFIEYYDKICTQIEHSREIRIHDDFTLWTALILRPETIARFVDSLEVIDNLVLECRKLGQIHSYYLDVLERNFEIAFGVYGLRFRAVEEISAIFEEVGLVDVIVERIVEFMSFEDLIVFA